MKSKKDARPRRKVCKLCMDRVTLISYRDERRLTRAVTERGKIVPRRISGNCAKHQTQITRAVKRARYLALLPFQGESYR